MSHSLRAKLSGLRYKGIITDKDYQRLKKALNVVDGLQDAIAEIKQIKITGWKDSNTHYVRTGEQVKTMVLDIIRKHTGVET